MFDTEQSYDIVFLGNKEAFNGKLSQLTHRSFFRFKAEKRTYFVTVEHFNFNVAAIKYCDVKDKNSKSAYTKIFNDNDGFKVLATCLKIMHNLWKHDPKLSFAFYAAHRPTKFNCKNNNRLKKMMEDEEYREKYIRTRFNVYEHAMINLFPPNVFNKVKDYKNCIYVLLNKKRGRKAIRLKQIGKYLLDNHDIIFESDYLPSIKNQKRTKRDIDIG